MKHLIGVLLVFWILGGSSVLADVEKGNWEYEFLVGIGCTDYDESRRNSSSTDYMAQFGAGYFFTESLSAGVRLGGQFIDDGFYPECALNIGPYFKLNFLTEGDVVPYCGGQLSYWHQQSNYYRPFSKDENQGTMFGPILGLRYFINEATYFLVEYQYRLFCCDVGEIADSANVGLIGFGFAY